MLHLFQALNVGCPHAAIIGLSGVIGRVGKAMLATDHLGRPSGIILHENGNDLGLCE